SEERRVGKECRSRWSPFHEKKKASFFIQKTRAHLNVQQARVDRLLRRMMPGNLRRRHLILASRSEADWRDCPDLPQRGYCLIAVSRRRQRNAHGCPAVARIDVNPSVVVENRAFDNRQA